MTQEGFAAPKIQLKGGNADMMSKYGCLYVEHCSLNSLALITNVKARQAKTYNRPVSGPSSDRPTSSMKTPDALPRILALN